jgi:gliding motility-associated-like protein
MKCLNLIRILLPFLWFSTWAQTPVVTNISTTNLYPKGIITITGSGFSPTSSNLKVIFGHAEGRIIASSDFSIEVEVPPAAKLSTLEVINMSSRRMTKSPMKFMPSFYGVGFNPSDFSSPITFPSTQELRDVASADFNSDGLPDLVMTKFSAASDILVMTNITNPATPSDIKYSQATFPVGYSTDHISTGDVDGDGKPDLVLTKGGTTNRYTVFVMLNQSTISTIAFRAPFLLNMETSHVAIQANVRDLNGDGRPEIIVSNGWNNILYIFPNDASQPVGSNPYTLPALKIAVTGVTNAYGLDVQDLDNDGKPDILLNQISTSDVTVLRNTSTTSLQFAEAQKIPVAGELRNITTADINKDDKLDIIVSSTNTNKVIALLNNSTVGNILFSSSPIVLSADSAPWGLSAGDIDGDLDTDIIVSHQVSSTINIFINDGTTSPSFAKHSIATTRPARNHVTGDLNQDGKPDIALATFVVGTYSVDILRNKICHKPVILNEPPLYICDNPITLRAIPALNATFNWKQGTTSVKSGADAFAEINAGGTYTVSVSTKDPVGECSNIASEPVTVTGSGGSVPSDPVLTTNSPLCSGSNINLSTTAVAGASYKWSGPNAWTTTTATNTTSIAGATGANAGSYTVQIIAGNCKSNLSAPKIIDIVVIDDFKITSNSATNSACAPNVVKLAVNNVAGFQYAWKKNSEAFPTPSATYTYDAAVTGAYYVKVSNAGLGCQKELGPVQVAIITQPTANFSIGDSRCANAPVQFTNSSIVDPNGLGTNPVAPVIYNWAFGDGKFSTMENPTNTYTIGGLNYNVTLTVSHQGVTGCTNSKVGSVLITNSTVPILSASPSQICPGENSTITVTPTFEEIVWDHGASGPTATVDQPGTYTAHGRDASGCFVPKSIVIGQKETPVITVEAETEILPPGQSVQLTANGAHVYEWSPVESLNNPTIADPVATPGATTTYVVTGSFIDGCSSTAQITITIDGSIIAITPPVAFTPNGDGPNDFWVIEGVEQYSDCTLNIFDGRGKRIYQKTGYTNDWDGTYQGKPVPGGTYYYVFSCQGSKPLTGNVLIYR